MSVGHLLAHALRALEEAQKDYIRKEKFCFRDSQAVYRTQRLSGKRLEETRLRFQCFTGLGKRRKGHAATILSLAFHRTAKGLSE